MQMEINKDAHFTQRRSVELASNLDGASLLDVKATEMKFAFLANRLVFPNKVTNERKKLCIMMCMVAMEFFFCSLEFYKFINAEKYEGEMVN